MGCPKSFSVSGGMGAALLTKPDLIHDVCATFWQNHLITCQYLWWNLDPSHYLFSNSDFDNFEEELRHTGNMQDSTFKIIPGYSRTCKENWENWCFRSCCPWTVTLYPDVFFVWDPHDCNLWINEMQINAFCIPWS